MQRPNVLKSVADILVGAVAETAGLGKDYSSADATKINQLMDAGRSQSRPGRSPTTQRKDATQRNLARRRRVTDI